VSAVAANAQRPARDERDEVRGLDEVEPAACAGIAREEGRRRQKELVNLAALDERAERVWAGLAEDSAVAARSQCIDDRLAREAALGTQ
jgi:hypothetical protein